MSTQVFLSLCHLISGRGACIDMHARHAFPLAPWHPNCRKGKGQAETRREGHQLGLISHAD